MIPGDLRKVGIEQTAERMFGFSSDDALGASLDLNIHERIRTRHWTEYRNVVKIGDSRYQRSLFSVPVLHKDGN
jgi:PAS domain-containing protein